MFPVQSVGFLLLGPCRRTVLAIEDKKGIPIILTGIYHGQRSLVGYIPWDHKELDSTEQLSICHVELRNGIRAWIYFIDYAIAFNCVDHNKLWKI